MYLFVFLVLLVALALLRDFLLLLFRQLCSPLRRLPGPPSPSFFMGNLEQMHDMENNNLIANWVNSYGTTFVYRGFIGGCRLMTTDPVAIAHILGNAYHYPKPDFVRESLASMAAGHDGLLVVEGADHRRQRKILAPAFSAGHIKSLSPIFWDKATELRDIWLTEVDSASFDPGRENSITRIDVLVWLGRATLDVIGLAGFGYAFNALTDDSNELARAFSVIFSTARKFRVMTILQAWFPFLRRFRRNNAAMAQAKATMRRIGLELIDEKRKAIQHERDSYLHEPAKIGPLQDQSTARSQGPKELRGRDLLSVLIQSNLSSDASQQMSEDEVLSQISTFLAAGHETTSSALTWCLYALANNRPAQEKLRVELRKLDAADRTQQSPPPKSDHEDLTERIARCGYLDWVVRESLRVHAPVTNTMRVCMRDEDEIPVQAVLPRKSNAQVDAIDDRGRTTMDQNVDIHGNRRSTISVRKWDIISVPIQAINKSEAFWGEDAKLFSA
uniref:Cytochrome P450 n=1 Tax=Psilocybe cubensis TaxID=181762 RepID=A0A8H7XTF7_PSICU